MSAPITAPFRVVLSGRREVKGKATREGQLWTLVQMAYPHATEMGFDLVKAQKPLAAKLEQKLGPKGR